MMATLPLSRDALFAQPASILLVDDNAHDRELAERELARHFAQLTCRHVGDAKEFESALAAGPSDNAIIDFRLQWSDGLTVLRRLKQHWPQMPVIMFTGSGSEEIAVEAMKEGVDDYLTKTQKNYGRLAYSVAACLERGWQRRQLDAALAALRESEARFREMAEAMPQIVYTTAPDGRITYINQQWHAYTGLDAARMRIFREVIPADDFERMQIAWRQSNDGAKPYEVEYRLRSIHGAYRWFLTRAAPLMNERHEVTGWVATSTDIHDQKRAEEELRDADRRKDEFIATLAHELRNPLAPIRSALQFMQLKKNFDAETRQAQAIIERQLGHMIRLVDDLLEVSRITAGKIQLRKERLNIYQIVLAAVEAARPLIEGAGHTLTVKNSSELVTVHVDGMRLAQVFGNLLSNAAKYTPPGGRIDVSVAREADKACVRVRDNGFGVPREMLSRIFDLFAQVHPNHTAQDGLGIGLALSRRLVELHGGTIAAISEGEGRGTEFIVRLPCATTAVEEMAPGIIKLNDKEPPLPRKVLVVDDNRDAADSLAMLLEVADCEVRKCYDGNTGFSLAREFHPDLMLLDVGMPFPDGLEVCRRLRREAWGRDIVIAALTGWGQEDDRRRTLEAGFDEHLVKPAGMEVILHLLAAQRAASVGNSMLNEESKRQ